VKTIIKLIKKLLRRTKAHQVKVDASYIIPRQHHHVSKTEISPNALQVLNRLNSAGFEAYLVGGSVRDLLLHKAPKDFDVATNATPHEIRALFRNARIIGRRFKLVHILYHREIIEVATFRGHEPGGHHQQTNDKGMLIRDNVYGSLEEDAWRRDFRVNSLYYNLQDASIVDFTGGVKDIEQRVLRIIGDPNVRYQEDPVRMLRAIRFSAKLQFEIAAETAAPLKTFCSLISHVSSSRLFDEMVKLYQCGEAASAQSLLVQYGFFALLFPMAAELSAEHYPVNALFAIALENTDTRIRDGKPVTPAFVFSVLLWFPLIEQHKKLKNAGVDPLPALDQAMSTVIAEQNKIVAIPRRYTQVMREIWLLQFRFDRRSGQRAHHLLEHPRFRAAYDFLALRALAGDASMELADWWTRFQEAPADTQQEMIDEVSLEVPAKPRKKRKPKPKPPQ
jgi:poly(A) polymerase